VDVQSAILKIKKLHAIHLDLDILADSRQRSSTSCQSGHATPIPFSEPPEQFFLDRRAAMAQQLRKICGRDMVISTYL
jgi:hypothetical protein